MHFCKVECLPLRLLQKRVCVIKHSMVKNMGSGPASLRALRLVVVSLLLVASDAVTIKERSEYTNCINNPAACTSL